MKNLWFSIMLVLVSFLFAVSASAQMTGRWVNCIEPNSGYLVQCFIPDQVQQIQMPQPQQQVYQSQPVYSTQSPVYQTPQQVYNSTPVYSQGPVYQQEPIYQQAPVYQTQQRTVVRQDYGGGINPYSGRPYGRYSRSTERTTIRVETNDRTYMPNIVLYDRGGGYYSPGYYW